jgi:chemotaxis protein MotC
VRRRVALILAALLAAGLAEAETRSATISEMTDELQRIQTRIAHGDKAAYVAQIGQLNAIGAAVAAARPETWRDKREADSIVAYILSGGSLAEVAPLVRGDALIESERSLARGAVAYITSHEADALTLLRAIDPGGLDRRIAGQVAFARSVLETTRDPKAAVSLLDWARLLAPGGLVEEAALRREVVLLAEARDVSGAARLTHDYAVRFGASLYAPDFFRDLARRIGRGGFAKEPADYQLFSRAASALAAGERLDFQLTLARTAIVNGRFGVASAAATDALREAPANSPDEARARLYLNAARIFLDGSDSALANLNALPKLDPSDAALLAAIRNAAAQFRLTPSPAAVEQQAASAGDEKAGAEAQTIRDAEAALKRTASLAVAGGGAP